MKESPNSEKRRPGRSLYTSMLLLLLAIISITAATTAWLSLADHTKVHSMLMDVSAGANIRFDLDPHATMDEYVRTLNFDQISQRILAEKGFDPRKRPMDPVTTGDYAVFTYEDGWVAAPESGSYMEFTLHFIASKDVIVHLTPLDSGYSDDGTEIISEEKTLPLAMRISFTDEGTTAVYDPGMGDSASVNGSAKTFGLPDAGHMVYTDANALFPLQEGVDKPIVVRIWLEGTDEACTDELQNADFQIKLRFEATDEFGNVIEVDPRSAR